MRAAILLALLPCIGQAAPAVAREARPRLELCRQPRAIDGDTIRCEGIRMPVRLLGVDAPELPGHCRKGRTCVSGDPWAARSTLGLALYPPVSVQPVTRDRYGRTVAIVRSRGHNLSCIVIERRAALYVPRWDTHGHIKAECAAVIKGAAPGKRGWAS